MMDTKAATDSTPDPAGVARDGFAALMAGDDHVVSGFKNKAMVAVAHVTPDPLLAEQHRGLAEPGTAGEQGNAVASGQWQRKSTVHRPQPYSAAVALALAATSWASASGSITRTAAPKARTNATTSGVTPSSNETTTEPSARVSSVSCVGW